MYGWHTFTTMRKRKLRLRWPSLILGWMWRIQRLVSLNRPRKPIPLRSCFAPRLMLSTRQMRLERKTFASLSAALLPTSVGCKSCPSLLSVLWNHSTSDFAIKETRWIPSLHLKWILSTSCSHIVTISSYFLWFFCGILSFSLPVRELHLKKNCVLSKRNQTLTETWGWARFALTVQRVLIEARKARDRLWTCLKGGQRPFSGLIWLPARSGWRWLMTWRSTAVLIPCWFCLARVQRCMLRRGPPTWFAICLCRER